MTEIPASTVVEIVPGHGWARLPKIAGAIGAVGLAASGALAASDSQQFFFSYLVAFVFWLSLALGGLFFVIVQHLTRAGWSIVVRRIAENVMGTLPLFAVLLIPVLVGLHDTHHHWVGAGVGQGGGDALIAHKSPYLNLTFFYIRAALYVGVWVFLANYFRGRSIAQDASGDPDLSRQTRAFSAPALALYALTQTFAAFDWIMSMDPHWYSTMFGVYYFSGSTVGIFALLIALVLWLQHAGLVKRIINAEHFHDLGKFLFGFVVFWTYIAFSQYFLIWYANIPEETLWFTARTRGTWAGVAYVLIVAHFFLPFFFLMPRTIKRIRSLILLGAVWMLAVHYVDLYWVIMPMHHPENFTPTLLDVTTLVGVGGLFVAVLAWRMGQAKLIPVRDPRLAESLSFENF